MTKIRKNKKIALVFRLAAFVFSLIAMFSWFGLFRGHPDWGKLQYYTILSCMLAPIMFAILALRTESDIRNVEDKINSRGFTVFRMICAANILPTMLIYFFWTFSSPVMWAWELYFDNMTTHLILPLLVFADYAFFSSSENTGKLKYRDVWYSHVFPVMYNVGVFIAGYKPYDFWNESGSVLAVNLAGGFALVCVIGHAFYFIDRRIAKKQELEFRFEPQIKKPAIAIIAMSIAATLCIAVAVNTTELLLCCCEKAERKWEQFVEYQNVVLNSGRFMHESGDPNKYIDVYFDCTLQVFGFDYYEDVLNDEEHLENWLRILKIEGHEDSRRFIAGHIVELAEAYKRRGAYEDEFSMSFDGDNYFSIWVGIEDETMPTTPLGGFHYIDENTIGFIDGLYVNELIKAH